MATKPNFKLMDKIVSIISDKEKLKKTGFEWDQSVWHSCGTAHCFAGYTTLLHFEKRLSKALVKKIENRSNSIGIDWVLQDMEKDELVKKFGLSKKDFLVTDDHTRELAKRLLNISEVQANALFRASNSLANIKRIIKYMKKKYGVEA